MRQIGVRVVHEWPLLIGYMKDEIIKTTCCVVLFPYCACGDLVRSLVEWLPHECDGTEKNRLNKQSVAISGHMGQKKENLYIAICIRLRTILVGASRYSNTRHK